MRAVRVATAAGLAASLIVLAPATARADLRSLHLLAGLTFSTLRISPGPSHVTYRLGVAAGAGFTFALTSRLSFDPQALLSQRGGKSGETGEDDRFTYVDVPLLARVALNPHAMWPVSVVVGPTIGMLLGGTSTLGSTSTDITSLLRRVDVGFVVGGEIQMSRRVFVEGRFVMGLNDVRRNSSAGSIKNSGLIVLVKASPFH